MNIKKSSLRIKLNSQRSSLSHNQVKLMSQQICENVNLSDVFMKSTCVALYSAFKNEVDLSVLLQTDKCLCLPVVSQDKLMEFHQCNKDTVFVQNKYGILEPQSTTVIPSEEIDLCLMPLVGFNRAGHRLGMGGGYYDRYFEHNKSHEKPTILAGVAYDFQEDNTIQSQSWDVPLDIIFTNKEVIYCEVK